MRDSGPKKLTGFVAAAAGGAEVILRSSGLARLHPREFVIRRLERLSHANVIHHGPFAGMRYVGASVGSALLPKLLGTYESELHHVVRRVCEQPPELIIDVGAAEGYYAVGLARLCTRVRVVAYEADAEGRKLLHQNAVLNDVSDRVDVRGLCTRAELAEALAESTAPLLIMDAEGAEVELLDPGAVLALRHTAILVELHPQFHSGIVEEICGRFRRSHRQEIIWQRPRAVEELPFGPIERALLGRWLILGTTEYRPVQMAWLWMTPVAGAVLE